MILTLLVPSHLLVNFRINLSISILKYARILIESDFDGNFWSLHENVFIEGRYSNIIFVSEQLEFLRPIQHLKYFPQPCFQVYWKPTCEKWCYSVPKDTGKIKCSNAGPYFLLFHHPPSLFFHVLPEREKSKDNSLRQPFTPGKRSQIIGRVCAFLRKKGPFCCFFFLPPDGQSLIHQVFDYYTTQNFLPFLGTESQMKHLWGPRGTGHGKTAQQLAFSCFHMHCGREGMLRVTSTRESLVSWQAKP